MNTSRLQLDTSKTVKPKSSGVQVAANISCLRRQWSTAFPLLQCRASVTMVYTHRRRSFHANIRSTDGFQLLCCPPSTTSNRRSCLQPRFRRW